MKHDITIGVKAFTPVSLTLTFESSDELEGFLDATQHLSWGDSIVPFSESGSKWIRDSESTANVIAALVPDECREHLAYILLQSQKQEKHWGAKMEQTLHKG